MSRRRGRVEPSAPRHDDPLTELALRASGGDRRSLEQFVALTMDDVHRYCSHLVGPARADDAAQATYLRAIRSLDGFRAESVAKAWLIGVARNTCLDLVRADARRARLRERLDQVAAVEARALPTSGGHGAVELDDLVLALAPTHREAFVLTQMLGFSYAEAASVLDCPVGTVRSRVSRAREALIVSVEVREGGRTDRVGR